MSNIVKLKRSSVFGKAPLPSQIEIGELCLNFNSSNPFLSFKDSENEIQKFLSENKVRNLIADVKNDVDASFYTKAESDVKYQSISGMSSYLTVASAESTYQPKGDYALVSQLPDLTEYALKSELPDLTDYALKSEIPDTSNLAEKSEIPDVSDFVTSAFTEATYAKKGEVPSIDTYTKSEADEKFQAQSGMTDYALKSEIPDLTDYALKSEIPDTSNLAEKSEIPDVSNFITSAFTEETYSKLGHTHSQYLTQTSADSRYARVVSCTQAEYDALVQNDQVEQGVLYCIYENSQSNSDSGNSGVSGNSGDSGNTGVPDDPIIPGPDPDGGNDF